MNNLLTPHHYVHKSDSIAQSDKKTKMDHYENYQKIRKSRNCFGKNGQPAILAESDKKRGKDLLEKHGVNLLVADRVPLDRTLPDYRNISRALSVNQYLGQIVLNH